MPITEEQLRSVAGGGGNVVTTAGDKLGGIGQIYRDDQTGESNLVTAKTGLLARPSPSCQCTAPVDTETITEQVTVKLALFGFYLGSSFAPNHIGMPLVSPRLNRDFLRRQVLMSRNISGGRFMSILMGGLNYQIEHHHLFPSMARPYLRKVQPLIAAYCAAEGVPGATITSPNIAGHRDYAATACPGDTFYPTLPAIRRDVAALIASSTPTPDTTPPSQPTDLTAVPGRTQVTLSWNAPVETDDINNYQVWRSSSATTGFAQAGTPTGTTFTVGSLSRRTTYYFRVRAVDTSGNIGSFSATVSARTS